MRPSRSQVMTERVAVSVGVVESFWLLMPNGPRAVPQEGLSTETTRGELQRNVGKRVAGVAPTKPRIGAKQRLIRGHSRNSRPPSLGGHQSSPTPTAAALGA